RGPLTLHAGQPPAFSPWYRVHAAPPSVCFILCFFLHRSDAVAARRFLTQFVVQEDNSATRVQPHRKTGSRHVRLSLGDGVGAEVKDGRGEYRRRVSVTNACHQVIQVSDPTRSYD